LRIGFAKNSEPLGVAFDVEDREERGPQMGVLTMKGRWSKNDGFLELGIHRIMDSAYFWSVLHPVWEPNLYTGSVFGFGIQPRGLSVDVERFRFQQCGNG
jgi:hypothetical protein